MRLMLILLAVLVTPLGLQADWFRSNALGAALEPLLNPDPQLEEYLLQREQTGGELAERLYNRGELVRERLERRTPEGDRIEEIRAGGTDRVIRYRNGVPAVEEIYRNGLLELLYRYGWKARQLQFIEASIDGAVAYRQEYRRDPTGRLRTLLRYVTEGDVTVLQFSYDETGLAETWVGGYSSGYLTQVNGIEVIRELRIEGERTVARIERQQSGRDTLEESYGADNNLISRTLVSPEGRVLKESFFRNNELIREREYLYENERLLETVIREPQRLERTIYHYEEGQLTREEQFVNRRLIRIVKFQGSERIEEFYRRGTIIIRRRYVDDELVGEEKFAEP